MAKRGRKRPEGYIERDKNNPLCPTCKTRPRVSYAAGRIDSVCYECAGIRHAKYRKRNPLSWMIARAKSGAKERGILFNISKSDIPDFPKFCPVFPWIELTWGEGTKDSTASLDRIDSSLGYVPGNVMVMSLKANWLKKNATWDELLAIGKFAKKMKKVLDKRNVEC